MAVCPTRRHDMACPNPLLSRVGLPCHNGACRGSRRAGGGGPGGWRGCRYRPGQRAPAFQRTRILAGHPPDRCEGRGARQPASRSPRPDDHGSPTRRTPPWHAGAELSRHLLRWSSDRRLPRLLHRCSHRRTRTTNNGCPFALGSRNLAGAACPVCRAVRRRGWRLLRGLDRARGDHVLLPHGRTSRHRDRHRRGLPVGRAARSRCLGRAAPGAPVAASLARGT